MEIKLANTPKEFDGIRKIWEERFTTCQVYLNTIFKEIFPLCKSYICTAGSRVVSVISLMPMRFVSPTLQTNIQGFYMFGVATLKEFEGKRIAAKLIEHASAEATTEGYDFIFERPANQSLNNYYFKLGFTISLPKLPYRFETGHPQGSTENITCNKDIESTAQSILSGIRENFPTRFEWENTQLLKGLIALGELEEHNASYTPTANSGETYIAVKNLSQTTSELFENSFFCFPME